MNEVEWSWTIEEVEAHVRALPIWQGEIELARLWGGLQNRSWTAIDESGKYVVRQAADLRDIWGTASATRTGSNMGSEIGISPKVVYDERLLSVTDWIEGRNFEPDDLLDEKNVSAVIGLIKILQEKGGAAAHYPIDYFWPFEATRQAGWIADRLRCKHMAEANKMIETCNRLEPMFGPYMPVICHADMAFVNMMQETATGRLWLIDYDLVGWGLPEWGIAEMCAYAKSPDPIDEFAVRSYFGAMSDVAFEDRLHRHRALRLTSSARIALLCWIIACGASLLSPEELNNSMEALFGATGSEATIDGLADYCVEAYYDIWDKYGDSYA